MKASSTFQKLKNYIEENIVKSVNEKKKLNVYKYIIPRDDFRDIMYWIIDAIKLYQPNPDIHRESFSYEYYYDVHPEEYPAFKEKVIRYVKEKSPIENVMLPLVEDFDYKRWSGRFSRLENMDEIMINEVVYNFGFEGFGRIYASSCYFYRTEQIK